MTIRTMVKKTISLLLTTEAIILGSYFYDPTLFFNAQVATLSSFLVIVGSAYSYKRMVQNQVDIKNSDDGKRDLLDTIEDPYELYDDSEINNAPADELDLKEIVKEEKSKIKTFSVDSAKYGARGSVSLFRLLPYLFLVLGFIALKNHEVLDIAVYLVSILVGIIVGSIASKRFTS